MAAAIHHSGSSSTHLKLHLHCKGPTGAATAQATNQSTIVFEAGLAIFSAALFELQDELANLGRRSCTYDRPGYAWSQPNAVVPLNPRQQVAVLKQLLQQAGEQGPFVMAGHSMGGKLVLLFAALYPDLVAGVVLLDATSAFAGQPSSAAAARELSVGAWSMALWQWLSPLGWNRAIRVPGLEHNPYRSAVQAQFGKTNMFHTMHSEWMCIACADVELTQLATGPPLLGDVSWPPLSPNLPVLIIPANQSIQAPAGCNLTVGAAAAPCTDSILGSNNSTDGSVNVLLKQAVLYNVTLSQNSSIVVCEDMPGEPCYHYFPWTRAAWLAKVLAAHFGGV